MGKQKYPVSGAVSHSTEGESKIRPGGYDHSFLDSKNNSKRLDAEQRNERYQSLSVFARIQMVKDRNAKIGGNSKRELERLAKLLVKQPEYPKQTIPVTVAPSVVEEVAVKGKSKYRAKKATAVKKEKKEKAAK